LRKMTDYETDALGLNSKPYCKLNIAGNAVEVRRGVRPRAGDGEVAYFCAYTYLSKSEAFSDSYLGATFKEAGWVGVDTCHSYNDKQTEAEKLADALEQIEQAIRKYKGATGD
jgi:hypothetical protein